MLSAFISISVKTHYLHNQSSEQDSRYAFAYTITINNNGAEPVTLLGRHWIITDANDQVHEILGDGVIGKQPLIEAGNSYCYTSNALLETSAGTMEGSYQMRSHSGEHFNAPIALFSLVRPGTLH